MNDLVKLWQQQPTEPFHMRIEQMEKKRRRNVFDRYLAFAVISLFVTWLAAVSPNLLMRVGAALTIAGLGFLAWQVHRHYGAAITDSSVNACRAELERQLAFLREGLWARLLAISPGPLLFSLGFAAAYPHAAPLIYFQIATFVLVVAIIPALNRRKAVALEREIEELRQLAN